MPGAATRSFGVARWQARVAVAGLSLVFLIAAGAVAAFVTALESPDLLVTSADAALLQDQLLDSQDSLDLLRTELLSAREASSDSAIAVAASRIVAGEKPAAKPVRATRLAHAPRVAAADRVVIPPRSLLGLRVMGRISSTFSRSRRHPILHIRRPHLGVDIAADRGTRINAPAAGRVTFVGHKFGFGLVVEIQHSPAVMTRYAHMRAATVEVGERVSRGMQIGTVGSSGITTGPHLHYEVLVQGHQVDPLRFVLPQSPEDAARPTTPDAASPDAGTPEPPDSTAAGRSERDSATVRQETTAPTP